MEYTEEDYRKMVEQRVLGWFWDNGYSGDHSKWLGSLWYVRKTKNRSFLNEGVGYFDNFRPATEEEVLKRVWRG